MSIVDQIRCAVSVAESETDEAEQTRSQLKDLDDVVTVLESIGFKLEPVFDISLTARIGALPKRAC